MVKGDFFALPPYLEHNTYAGKDRGNELVLIDFMPSLINQHMDDWGNMESFVDFAYIQPLIAVNEQLLPKLCLSLSGQVLVEQLIFDMEKEMIQKLDGYRLAVKAHLLRLLVIIGREYKQFLQGRHDGQVIAKYRKVFYEIFRFMDEHFNEELSLERMADKANMSPTHFSAMFKVVKGKNFIEHLNELRIRKSMDLLINTDNSVMNISLTVGFNHLGHFNKTFKKIVGATPSHYRKMAGL
jgi:AraC-like DNA-binding protein